MIIEHENICVNFSNVMYIQSFPDAEAMRSKKFYIRFYFLSMNCESVQFEFDSWEIRDAAIEHIKDSFEAGKMWCWIDEILPHSRCR